MLFVEYLGQLFPGLSISDQDSNSIFDMRFLHLGPAQLLALAVIACFTVINYFGIRIAAGIQNLLTGGKVLLLGTFTILAFSIGTGDWNHLTQSAVRTSPHSVGAQFAISLIYVMYAYSGWNAATYVAEEIRDPERTLPRALVLGTAIVAVIYLGLTLAFLYALPLVSMKGNLRVGASAAVALFGNSVGGLFSGIMAVCILSSVSAMVIVGARVNYAMAEDRCFFLDAAKVHPRWRTPSRAIIYQGIAAGVMVVTATFEGLAYYIGVALVFFAALATAGVIRLRRRTGWKHLPALNLAFPLLPAVFILAGLWMLSYGIWLRPRVALMCGLTLAAGMLFFRLKVRKTTQ